MFQFTHFPCDWENIYIYILYLIIIIKSELWTITHCLGLGHERMVCAVCLSVPLWHKEVLTRIGIPIINTWRQRGRINFIMGIHKQSTMVVILRRSTQSHTRNISLGFSQLPWNLMGVSGLLPSRMLYFHYNDVIIGAVASQITSITIVYSTVDSDVDLRKHQSSASPACVRGIHPVTGEFVPGEFPAQMISNAENVSIWWRHHAKRCVGNNFQLWYCQT